MKFHLTLFLLTTLTTPILLSPKKPLQKPARRLFEQSLYNENATNKYQNADLDQEYKTEVNSVTNDIDKSMQNLNDQKFAMKKIMEKTMDRKEDYVKYAYHKMSYEVDTTLNYLLNKIADIDGGMRAKEYLKSNDYNGGYDN